VAFSPDGQRLATTRDDRTIRLWNVPPPLNTGVNDLEAESVVLRGHEAKVRAVAFSPDGHWLATGGNDDTAQLWDISTNDPGREPMVLSGHEGNVLAVAFSPDGQRLATTSADRTARLWSVDEPTAESIILRGHEGSVWGVAFSLDGRWLATAGGDRTARLWNVSALLNTGGQAPATELRGHDSKVNAVAFSPDGRWLATASDDGTARLWQVNDPAAEPVVLPGHEVFISAVAFSPDGHWLAMASADRIAWLWDVSTLLNIGISDLEGVPLRLHGHSGLVSAVAFSPDGRWLATASDDGLIRLWHMNLDELMALACVTAGRDLNRVEWNQFLPGEVYRRTC
jgi:WD40 repeat protein